MPLEASGFCGTRAAFSCAGMSGVRKSAAAIKNLKFMAAEYLQGDCGLFRFRGKRTPSAGRRNAGGIHGSASTDAYTFSDRRPLLRMTSLRDRFGGISP